MSLLRQLPVLILDCQTSGASPAHGQIIELGWSVFDGGRNEIVSRLVRLADDATVPERIKKLTGITDSDMESAHSPLSVLEELTLALPPGAPVISHWAQFEKTFTDDFYRVHRKETSPLDFICTCQIAKRLFPDLPSRAIRALGGYLGLTIGEHKRAADHVEATVYIWKALIERLEAADVTTLEELREFLSRPVPRASSGRFDLPMERLKRLTLPKAPGVYQMLSSSGKILYVGKATSLKSRVNSYFTGRKNKDSKTRELISQIHDIRTIVCATPLEAALLECDLIKQHDPQYNRALRERKRELVYFDRDFSVLSREQDATTPLGPFVSDAMAPLLAIAHCIAGGDFDESLFWNMADIETIEEGLALFIDDYLPAPDLITSGELATSAPVTVRSLLALGLWIYRAELNQALSAERACGETVDAEVLEIEDIEEELESEEEVDAFTIEEMILGILKSSARLYLHTRKLTALLDCRVDFCETRISRTLLFEGGLLVTASGGESRTRQTFARIVPHISRRHPWRGLDIDTYDRLRVLYTELGRLISRGRVLPLRNLISKEGAEAPSNLAPVEDAAR